jgi:hypothetical protein
MEYQDRMTEAFFELYPRLTAGEISQDEFDRLIVERTFPGDLERQRRMVASYKALEQSGALEVLKLAVRLPGVAIPVGKPGEN